MPDAQIIQFPTPAASLRPVLKPSIHPRGGRPYVYHGKLDEWHAPGAITTRDGNTSCAVDAAWLVEAVLGPPKNTPVRWPGVAGARERAIEYGTRAGLYGYQREGAAFLAERDWAALTDGMGIGKTSQALCAAEARLSLGIVPTPTTPVVLVLCPALAKRHWEREIKRWTGHDAAILDGLKPDLLPQARYIIANYDILYGARRSDASGVVHDLAHLPGWQRWLANRFLIAILDEFHVLGGRTSRRRNATKATCHGIPVVWGLSGTPVKSHVREMWALIDLLSDGLAGPYWPWARVHCGAFQGQYGWIDKGGERLDELSRRLTFFMLGRTAEGVKLELPEIRHEVFRVDVEVSAPTRHEGYSAIQAKAGAVVKALRMTARAKRAAVIEMAVEALEAKQKIVVFTYMREQADAIAKGIRDKIDCHVACVHGDMTPEGRDAQAGVFREVAAPAAFVCTIDSVGLAISLVGAHLGIFADLTWEPHELLQAVKRLHRIGGDVRVLIRWVIGVGTIDEAVAEHVISKLSMIQQTMGAQTEQQEMQAMLGGRSSESIIESLFERLKGLASTED